MLAYVPILFFRVQILAIVPGMQQLIAKYMEVNKLILPPMKYSLYAGQLTSRGFKEKLLNSFKSRGFVRIFIYLFTELCICKMVTKI